MRETTIFGTPHGRPVANAIVWQSRVTAPFVRAIEGRRPGADRFASKTGLVVDAYFSGTKIDPSCSTRFPDCGPAPRRGHPLRHGRQLFVLAADWRQRHVTDYSNASRTLMFNIHTLDWDDELL